MAEALDLGLGFFNPLKLASQNNRPFLIHWSKKTWDGWVSFRALNLSRSDTPIRHSEDANQMEDGSDSNLGMIISYILL